MSNVYGTRAGGASLWSFKTSSAVLYTNCAYFPTFCHELVLVQYLLRFKHLHTSHIPLSNVRNVLKAPCFVEQIWKCKQKAVIQKYRVYVISKLNQPSPSRKVSLTSVISFRKVSLTRSACVIFLESII